ncbi:MAG: heme exporter protein CcmB [Ignavibacteriales bacterium]|nr:heme exporter protein CcmB [Ignavibacteriales bacterium]
MKFQSTYALVMKDVRSELRTRYALNALLMFVVTSVTTVLFALRSDNPSAQLLAGMFWVVVFFTAMSGLSRIFVSEEERGTTLTLRLLTIPSVVFVGKLVVNCLLTLTLTAAVSVLYVWAFPGFAIVSWDVFIATVFLGSLGFASASTILAAIIAKANVRGSLYPVLAFPVLVPLLMTVMNATARALEGETIALAFGDLQVLVGYLLVMTAGSFLLFDYVWVE